MYCSLGQNQFFDDAGAPLSAGRVKIYAKGSDTLLPIFEDNGGAFVPAQNPVITANDGRIPTVFWPAALVDVVVEKSNGDGTYTELDSYVAGLDLSSIDVVSGLGSVAELRGVQPSENMVVQVNGYYTAGDSPTRKYLWVSGAANTDDGGYVIASDVSDAGRWVMLWDDPEFLPASLYGIMCGYSGYEKTSNLSNFFEIGNSVQVGTVRIVVPPVLLFDWRMAQPTSGQSSPIAYHMTGTFTTSHYVACSSNVVFAAGTPPTIHCAGVRGESYASAYWMVDQDYGTSDPFEIISTSMFRGNTAAMHDAFMACAACDKVRFIEMQSGTLYDTLDSGDTFVGKIIVDHRPWRGIYYTTSNCVVFASDAFINTGSTSLANLIAKRINADSVSTSGDISTSSNFVGDGADSCGYFTKGIGRDSSRLPGLEFSDHYMTYAGTRVEKDSAFMRYWAEFVHPFHLKASPNGSDGNPHVVSSPASGTTATVNLASGDYSSYYTEGDILLVSNLGAGVVNVQTGVGTEVLNAGMSSFFVKRSDGNWNVVKSA